MYLSHGASGSGGVVACHSGSWTDPFFGAVFLQRHLRPRCPIPASRASRRRPQARRPPPHRQRCPPRHSPDAILTAAISQRLASKRYNDIACSWYEIWRITYLDLQDKSVVCFLDIISKASHRPSVPLFNMVDDTHI